MCNMFYIFDNVFLMKIKRLYDYFLLNNNKIDYDNNDGITNLCGY